MDDVEKLFRQLDKQLERNEKSVYDFLTRSGAEKIYSFSNLPDKVIIHGSYDENCKLVLGKKALEAITSKRLNLVIGSMGPAGKVIKDAFVYIGDASGRLQILFGSGGSVVLGSLGAVTLDVRIGHSGVLVVGDKTTVNGARVVAVNSNILVGQDGLWSDEILAQGFDQHGIVDMDTREIINLERRDIVTEQHVWIGRRVTLMPMITIGKGSIVGTGAIVTKSVPSFSSAVGVPARVVRDKVSWSRPWTGLDVATELFFDSHWPQIQSARNDDV
jgi:acetyltransferase-like isoleucine patch superfamily enzyme